MFAPIFELCAASSQVTALLGSDPIRFWLFGEAPQDQARPYAVWQGITGDPDNHLNEVPKFDHWSVQIDIYAQTASESRAIAQAIRNAVEPTAYVTMWNGEFKDFATGLFRYSFTIEFLQAR